MKRTGAVVASAIMLAGAVVSSGAWAQSIQIGPGGVRVRPDDDRMHRRRGFEERGQRCRVVIEKRRNRFGERVTERRRICRE